MELTTAQERRLRKLVSAFLEENKKLNLSAHRTEESCWIGNVLDSLAAMELPLLQDAKEGSSVIDIGTGGGFPLLPLAILLPHCRFTGIDATRKKVDAVGRIIQELRIPNVPVVCGRAEDVGQNPQHREQYDIVLSRAVAELSTLLEITVPFARIGGSIILWKSLDIAEELQASSHAQQKLSCALADQHRYALPGDWGERQLLVYRKTGTTPGMYPRPVGVPKKRPL